MDDAHPFRRPSTHPRARASPYGAQVDLVPLDGLSSHRFDVWQTIQQKTGQHTRNRNWIDQSTTATGARALPGWRVVFQCQRVSQRASQPTKTAGVVGSGSSCSLWSLTQSS